MMSQSCWVLFLAAILAVLSPHTAASAEFKIDINATGILEFFTQSLFTSAADKWSSVITGDLPDVDMSDVEQESALCGPFPEKIDDLWICARWVPIDFFNGILGMAGPTLVRTDTQLTVAGLMAFDKFDFFTMLLQGSLGGVFVCITIELDSFSEPLVLLLTHTLSHSDLIGCFSCTRWATLYVSVDSSL